MTFSIVGRCSKTGELGICVTSAVLSVGSVVPHAELDVGVIATQATAGAVFGTTGLQLMKLGVSASSVLEALLRKDEKRESRQVTMIDRNGEVAVFTGRETIQWSGHLTGKDYAAAGNMLTGPGVIEVMARTFESSEGALEERLIKAIEGGLSSGGDKRGRRGSAALLLRKRLTEAQTRRPSIDLRVDDHPEPVKELKRLYELWKTYYSPSSPSFRHDWSASGIK